MHSPGRSSSQESNNETDHCERGMDFRELSIAYSLARPADAVDKEKRRSIDVHSMSFFTDPAGEPFPSFGLRNRAMKLAYPGAWKGIQNMVAEDILDGRFQLTTKYGGKRAKLQAVDGNLIDTMYVDKRRSAAEGQQEDQNARGNTLVICCDGNSAFYETGYMPIAIRAGYSTLGWNPPGFACSTGSPCPEQIRNAVDVVMSYALNVLQFHEKDIMLFAYSIG
ncbi:hypothetical protein RvY_08540-2 [Ramazzottius varieornatus]|nr:hypothetical protein RvY_08540-2 [Ramazzottius varieornatus]